MSIILFYLSLILIVGMFAAKHYNVPILHHEALHEMVSRNEKHVYKIAGTGKEIVSKIHFENLNKLIVLIASFIKKETIILKRKFDSKQPKFLLKAENPNMVGKHSVSFFLKNISEHKNSFKKKDL